MEVCVSAHALVRRSKLFGSLVAVDVDFWLDEDEERTAKKKTSV